MIEREDNAKTATALFECLNYLIAYHDETNQHHQIQLMKNQNLFDALESPEFENSFKHFSAKPSKDDESAESQLLKKMAKDSTDLIEEVKAVEESTEHPSHGWFVRWREGLLLPNIKVTIQHTYSKAMAYRNQMIEGDAAYNAANQIVNIDEDALATYLQKYSLKGLLPTMPKILVTTYRGNQSIDTWLISYVWTLVF